MNTKIQNLYVFQKINVEELKYGNFNFGEF